MKKALILILLLGIILFSTLSAFAAETITVWAMGAEAKKIGAMVEKFEKAYPGLKVKVQAIPWSSAHDKLITAIAGGTVPDVAQMGTTWMAEFGSIGVFEDVSNYLKNSKVIKEDDFFEGSLNTNIVDGKLYGIPWYVDTRVLFYRTDLLAEVGYDHPPRTWEELEDVARKLAADGGYGLALSTNNYQEFMPFVWQNGGRILDENGEVAVTEPAFVEALEFYVKLFKEGLAPIDAQGTNLFQEFAAGRMPMYFSGPWMVNLTHEQVPEIDGKWSVALMPEKKSRTSFIGGCNLVIFKDSKHKEAAWKFIEFMTEAQNQVEWFKISGCLPANKWAWEDTYFNNLEMMQVFGEQLKDAKAPINIPQWAQIESFIQRRVQEACYGEKTPKEAAEALARDIEGVL
ncbi:hypothetical protein BBF96_10425 [Anoxybacter fermentans]|uniref:ABC transporter substrate-binding protein n=1 Tax=Anoxybacter fermentans TaxID=1323375 RepID=A0A3Q9HRF2_9FIRM|nr:sugar ABC transporter substrate-binding protein [Anoxybacter fermentans]AZR73763.1 hypothetical protein BBF96_10425 [Anoxybacter fermentans]